MAWESGDLISIKNGDATKPLVAPPIYVRDWWGALIDLEISGVSAGVGSTLLSADSFNRANSTTVLGSTDGAGTLDPLVWEQEQGGTGWGINTNQAYTPTGVGLPQFPIATVDLQTADVDLRLGVPNFSNQSALVFRWTDINNYWYVFYWTSSPKYWLVKVQAGVVTIFNMGTSPTFGFRVVAQGSLIVVRDFSSGAVVLSITDTFNQNATRHGMRTSNEFTPNDGGDSAVRFDNWAAYAPPPQLLELDMTWGEINQQGDDLAVNPFPPLRFVIQNGQPLLHALSHRGPYLKLQVAPSLVTNYNLRLRHSNRQERAAELFNGPLINFSGPIAPGSTKVFPFPGYVGPIYAFASATGSTTTGVTVSIHGVDLAGDDYLLEQIFRSDAVEYQQPRELWLPGLACYVKAVNTDVGAQSVNFSLTPAYR